VPNVEGEASAPANVREITSVEEWKSEIASSHSLQPLVVKFTAEWCKPCQEIDPFFRNLATKYNATFLKVDVDELNEVASECNVALMPTFVVFSGQEKKGSVSGASEEKLERLIQEHCARRVHTR